MGFHRQLCLHLPWAWPLTQSVCSTSRARYIHDLISVKCHCVCKYLRRYCIQPVLGVVAYCDLDLRSQKQISTSTNPNTSATKIGWNSLQWFVKYGVHKDVRTHRLTHVLTHLLSDGQTWTENASSTIFQWWWWNKNITSTVSCCDCYELQSVM